MDYEQLLGSARRALATFLIISCAIALIVVIAYPRRDLLREGDSDYDGQPDHWQYDTNGDSSADLWVSKSLGSDAMTKEIVVKRKDTNYDGVVDWTRIIYYPMSYFPNTTRTLEVDRDYNGRIDHRILWVNGKKMTEAWIVDRDGDGVEECEEVDLDGDGLVDSQSWYHWIASVGEVIPGEPYNYVERDLDMDGVVDVFAVLRPTGEWLETNTSMLS